MTADTRRIEISSDNPLDLEAGMKLAFDSKPAKSYGIIEKHTAPALEDLKVLIFKPDYTQGSAFPCPLPVDVCIDIALEWLRQVKYPAQPSTDGGVKKGFIITAGMPDAWEPITLCAIEPAWMIYGK